jgi:Uma2 family endonuclease
MAGGTPEHAALAMSVGAALVVATRGGPCRVHSSDLRVRALATGLATYPDVTVVCGPYDKDPESQTTIANPRVVVEVTSRSTEESDRGDKLESYKRIPSLAAVVLVSHSECLIEVFERQDDGAWQRSEARRGAAVSIGALTCELAVDDIYGAALLVPPTVDRGGG